jgi:hypothetical protein
MRRHTWLIGLFIVIATASAVPAKDLALRQRTTISGPTTQIREGMQYWTATKTVSDDPHMRTITDLSAKTITMIEKDKKTYFTRSFAELQQDSEAMKKRLENLPPEAKKMMGADVAVTVTPTGKTEKIAGYEAKEYAIQSGGSMSGSVWVSEALQNPAGALAADAFKGPLGGPGNPGSAFAEAMTKLKGVPLRTAMVMGMAGQKITSVTEVLEVSEKSAPADVLAVPAGFQKGTAPSLGAHAR